MFKDQSLKVFGFMLISKKILPIIIIAQFFCTSLWFASNSIIQELTTHFTLNNHSLEYLTSSVQFGFITGTLLFAFLMIVDRFSPSKVFFTSAVIGALFNLGILYNHNTYSSLLLLRFLTGFSLAGIYPVGMKISADYFDKGLGKSLGFLVGALVLGTAFPHLLKTFTASISWQKVIVATSSITLLGGVLILLFVPDGPYRKASQKIDLKKTLTLFKASEFRKAAFGYFGHMWELYTFWTFVPFFFLQYQKINPHINFNISLYSFIVIGIGSLSCIIGGYLSEKFGTKKIATLFLLSSGICCLLLPFFFNTSPKFFTSFLVFWGCVVIADSPLFSTLIAQSTDTKTKGTALTIVNCIGFSITIISIQFLSYLSNYGSIYLFTVLGIGPALGLIYLLKSPHKKSNL